MERIIYLDISVIFDEIKLYLLRFAGVAQW